MATLPNRVTIAAHAKVNLFLHVLAREESGFHSIETLFALLELHDVLEIEKTAAGVEITVVGADTGPAADNLASRAAATVLQELGQPFGVRINLTKAIPVQAGLGGGSSDGAAALHGVNMLAGCSIPDHRILEFAAGLGSDVPFFASRAACAVAWGSGGRLLEVRGPGAAPALVVHPGFGVSTGDAYRSLSKVRGVQQSSIPRMLFSAAFADWSSIRELSGNDFETVVLQMDKRLADLYSSLEETGPLLTRLCGSGSAVVAIYETERKLDAARDSLRTDHLVIPTSTRSTQAPAPMAD